MLKIGTCTLNAGNSANPVVPAAGKSAVVLTTILSNSGDALAFATLTVAGHPINVPVPAGDTVFQTYKYIVTAAQPLTVTVTEGAVTVSMHYDDGGAA